MWSDFFRKPVGVGAGLNAYMFLPHRLLYAIKLFLFQREYFLARVTVIFYQLYHPAAPWLTSAAISYLDKYLTKDMHGFEWGSGRSTKWFAKRVRRLVSVEDDLRWFKLVQSKIAGLSVDYRYIPSKEGYASYIGQIVEFPDSFFDFVLIDGSHRNSSIRAAVSKVKQGGIIIIDNADSDLDVAPLAFFERIETTNGVWRTDIYIRKNS